MRSGALGEHPSRLEGCPPDVVVNAVWSKVAPVTAKPFSSEQLAYSTLVFPAVVLAEVNSSADVEVCALTDCAKGSSISRQLYKAVQPDRAGSCDQYLAADRQNQQRSKSAQAVPHGAVAKPSTPQMNALSRPAAVSRCACRGNCRNSLVVSRRHALHWSTRGGTSHQSS